MIIAGGGSNGVNEVKIFDSESNFKPCCMLKDFSRACYTVDFSHSGDLFACAGGDGVIRVLSVANDSLGDDMR